MPKSFRPRPSWKPHDLRLASALVQYHLLESPEIEDSDAELFTTDGIKSVADWLEMVGKRGMASIPPQAAIFSSELLRGVVEGGFEGECKVPLEEIRVVADFLQRLGRTS